MNKAITAIVTATVTVAFLALAKLVPMIPLEPFVRSAAPRPPIVLIVSWAQSGSQPYPVGSVLGEADVSWLKEWEAHLLRDPDEAEQVRRDAGVERP